MLVEVCGWIDGHEPKIFFKSVNVRCIHEMFLISHRLSNIMIPWLAKRRNKKLSFIQAWRRTVQTLAPLMVMLRMAHSVPYLRCHAGHKIFISSVCWTCYNIFENHCLGQRGE